jgi:hypothetical protein
MTAWAYDLIAEEVNPKVREFVYNCPKVNASAVGLDDRCGKVYVAEDAIICYTGNDRQLQYYGGFEYVDKDYRMGVGDFVFYFSDDERVNNCLDHFRVNQKDEAQEELA